MAAQDCVGWFSVGRWPPFPYFPDGWLMSCWSWQGWLVASIPADLVSRAFSMAVPVRDVCLGPMQTVVPRWPTATQELVEPDPVMHTRHMDQNPSTTAFASSTHPGDWGRALACALSTLTEICGNASMGNHESLLGQELQLVISPEGGGVNMTLSWSPRTP